MVAQIHCADESRLAFAPRASSVLLSFFAILGLGCQSADLQRHFVTYRDPGESAITFPFVVNRADLIYRNPVEGVCVGKVTADGKSVDSVPFFSGGEHWGTIPLDQKGIIYLVTEVPSVFRGQEYFELRTAIELRPEEESLIAYLIPIGSRHIRVQYRIRHPGGQLSAPQTLDVLED